MAKHTDRSKAAKDMDADEAAFFALHTIFDRQPERSFEKAGAKFLYCSLTKDESCPMGMYLLGRFLQMFLSDKTCLALHKYSLSQISSNNDYFSEIEKEINQLASSGSKLQPRLDPKLALVFNLSESRDFFLACRTFVGHLGEALEHKTKGAELLLNSFDDYCHLENFQETEKYQDFLVSNITYADDYVEQPLRQWTPTKFSI